MTERSSMTALTTALADAAARRGLDSGSAWRDVVGALAGWDADGGDGAPGPGALIDASLGDISAVFRLEAASSDLLLVAAAADLDPNIALAYGLLLGAAGPRPATVALALELAGISIVSPAGRVALGPAAPLRQWGLAHLGDGEWMLGRTLTAGPSVVGALVGEPVDDVAAVMMLQSQSGPEDVLAADGVAELSAALAAGRRLCWVENPAGGAGVAVARTAFAESDIRCVTMNLTRRPPDMSIADAARSAVRFAGLHRAAVLVDSAEDVAKSDGGVAAIDVLARAPMPVVMVGSCRWNASWHHFLPTIVRAAPLTTEQRLAVWRRHIAPDQVADVALMPYRLSPDQIETVAQYVAEQERAPGQAQVAVRISEAIRLLSGSPGVRAGLGWAPTSFGDLHVPDQTQSELKRFASWVRLRDTVTSGGAVQGLGGKGTGIAALFTGGPGTGKTLAAHVIADNAGLDLMQVDLSGVVDKYIGETEKNLEKVFSDAENLNVVLFFDEADALFGKRSDVRDAHDRFANQEVAYLLQRMEHFDGVTILATNLKGNLDVAFSRRLHFIVHFPDPDEATRQRLWRGLLAHAGPANVDDPIDVPALAAALDLSGGDIRNIVLGAVYDAAAAGSRIGMTQVRAAAVREYAKLGRRMPAERLGG